MKQSAAIDDAWLAANPLPVTDPDSDKNARGRVLVVGSARFVPGAIRLTGEAALRAGAGKLQLATVADIASHLGVLVPEAAMITLPTNEQGEIGIAAGDALEEAVAGCDTLILGPGMSENEDVTGLVSHLISKPRPDLSLVLDAAAFVASRDLGPDIARHGGRVIVTPHIGELAAFTGCDAAEIETERDRFAQSTAESLNATVILKSSVTVIAQPEGDCMTLAGNCVGLATGGSGDVLAGLIGGFLARGADVGVAAGWGVWLHNAAGRELTSQKGTGFLARELVERAPFILQSKSPPSSQS